MLYSADQIKKQVWEEYNKDPLDWKILVGRDNRNFYELLILHKNDYWLIKEERINPYETVGIGVKGRTKQEIVRSKPEHDFGLRPLPKDKIFLILNALKNNVPIKEIISRFLAEPPISAKELNTPFAIYGPIFTSQKPIDIISNRHQKLRDRLQMELEKLLNKKYPHILSAYG